MIMKNHFITGQKPQQRPIQEVKVLNKKEAIMK